jgi:hypothetical protein
MFTNKIKTFVILACVMPAAALAFDIPGVPKSTGSDTAASGQAAVNPKDAEANFFKNFTASYGEINVAQQEFAAAFELKDKAELLKIEGDRIASGSMDADGVKKAKEVSDSVNAAVAEKMADGAPLTAEGQQHYLAALPHMAKGTIGATKLSSDVQAFQSAAQAAASSASISEKMGAAKLVKTAGAVAAQVPGFVSTTVDTYKAAITYGKSKNIKLPADATAAL